MPQLDTIAATATAPAPGAIGIVRVSGADSLRIVRLLCPSLADPQPRRAYLASVIDPDGGNVIDEAQVLLYRAPHSYTGEDGAEIQCHGGPLVVANVLAAVLASGARPASPGEFTRRAFENGRIDLARAEAVADLIAADSTRALMAAQRQLAGELSGVIRRIRYALVDLCADLAASADFPDEADGEIVDLDERLRAARSDLGRLLRGHSVARRWRDGARVVLAGVPNVGKSSLLNVLVGSPRAIVDAAPGTTRDTVEERTEIGGIGVVLVDTAGLRPAENSAEGEGIARAQRAIRSSDLVLHVIDASDPRAADIPMELQVHGRPEVVVVLNKTDLGAADLPPGIDAATLARVSAKTGAGIEALRNEIATRLGSTAPGAEAWVTSERHAAALSDASAALDRAMTHLGSGASELAGVEVDQAVRALGTITGEDASVDLIDRIFARFCIGK